MQLLGRRIMVNIPEKKSSGLELDKKTEDDLMREAMKLWSSLEIFAIGDEVNKVKPGDKVYLTTASLEHSEKIEIDGKMKFMLSEYDVAFIW